MKLSIFTSMTNPEERMDPWQEALTCYKDFADEVITVGEDWDTNLVGKKLAMYFKRVSINVAVIG